MRKIFASFLTVVFLGGVVLNSYASPKKREPDKREVEKILQSVGEKHYQEGMKIRPIGKIETGILDKDGEEDVDKSYFWVFCATLDDDAGYQIIIFDNVPNYLGYYPSRLNATECGEIGDSGYIKFNQGDYEEGEDQVFGGTDSWTVKIPLSAPPNRLSLKAPDGTPSDFVKAPEKEEPKTGEEVADQPAGTDQPAASAATDSPTVKKKKKIPEYREWNVTLGNKVINVESAIFVEMKDGNVTIKNGKNGREATFKVGALSAADKEYLKNLLQ